MEKRRAIRGVPKRKRKVHWGALLVVYGTCALLPLLTAWITVEPQQRENPSFALELGRAFALVGIGLFVFQGILAARIKQIERGWGLDLLMQVHRAMGLLALLYVILHPLLIAWGLGSGRLLFSLDLPWYIWAGRAALAIAILQVLSSVCRQFTRLSFEQWRVVHNIGAPLLIILAFFHSGFAGHDTQGSAMLVLWALLPLAAFGIHGWHRLRTSSMRPLSIHRVTAVEPETRDVTTLAFAPGEADAVYPYLPGQFHFVTLRRGRDLPVEEHHFTISSSPARRDVLTSTIKGSGDFTGTIRETEKNDLAILDGPYGRFSYLLYPEEKELVFVAGGIGITPLMSMLRHLRDAGADGRQVTLLYANKSEDDIVFYEELKEMAEQGSGWFRFIPFLTRPSDAWNGERGRIDADRILEQVGEGERKSRGYYVCGPSVMIEQITKGLRKAGVSRRHLHSEAFKLLKSHLPPTHRNRRARTMIATMAIVTVFAALAFAGSRVAAQKAADVAQSQAAAEARPAKTWTVKTTVDLKFQPETLTLRVGDTVEWENPSPLPHTATADPEKAADSTNVSLPDGAEPFDSGTLQKGETYSRTFKVAGTYRYVCLPHESAGMLGTLHVEPKP